MARRQVKPAVPTDPRERAIHDLQTVRAEIRDHLIRAGIQESEINVPTRHLDKLTTEQIQELLLWHSEFRNGPWTAVQTIWKLREPAFWENLMMFGQHKMREQKLLKVELKKLRIAWRKRHGDPEEQQPDDQPKAKGGKVKKEAASVSDGTPENPE